MGIDYDDLLTAMERELVTQKGVGESASAVWKGAPAANGFVCRRCRRTGHRTFDENIRVDGTTTALVFGSRIETRRIHKGPSSSKTVTTLPQAQERGGLENS